MLNIFRNINTLAGIKKDLKYLNSLVFELKRSKLIKKYFQSHSVYKLHLGSNKTELDGWLNSDIIPQNKKSIFLDVTKRFPFNENSFHFVFCEHLIEHLSLDDGLFMLKECFRILKRNGRIRIGTPDLNVILQLYTNRVESFGDDYIKWSQDNFSVVLHGYHPIIVVNTLFHNWDHKFLYDFDLLSKNLLLCGFTSIERFEYSQSNDIHLQNIERHHENVGSLEMVKFETLIIEAKKAN